MRIKTGLLIVLLSVVLGAMAQSPIQVTGKVINASTSESLAFVNIGIEGTLIGTASTAEGTFSFEIPAGLAQKNLYFSAIGFQNLIVPLQQFLLQNGPVQLQALSYGIEDVEISTQSKVLYRIVRDAAKSIPDKFIHQPFSCQALYQNEEYTKQVLVKKRDAMVLYSDGTGYTSKENAFESIHYKFLNVQRNFDVKSLSDGTTLMDELLAFDIARTPANILDLAYLNDYDLDLVGTSQIEGDSVWVIGYRLSKPSLSLTGDVMATSCEGKLYISKLNSALLKAEAHLYAPVQSRNGRSVVAEKTKGLANVGYRYTTTYKSTKHGYVIDRISLSKSFINENGEPAKVNTSFLVIEINTEYPQMVEKRQYFENMLSDPDFWSVNEKPE